MRHAVPHNRLWGFFRDTSNIITSVCLHFVFLLLFFFKLKRCGSNQSDSLSANEKRMACSTLINVSFYAYFRRGTIPLLFYVLFHNIKSADTREGALRQAVRSCCGYLVLRRVTVCRLFLCLWALFPVIVPSLCRVKKSAESSSIAVA